MGTFKLSSLLMSSAVAVALFIGGGVANAETLSGAKPVDPQPDSGKLKPGLAVTYYYAMFEDVKHVGTLVKGKKGEPLELLDHVGADTKVLTSKKIWGVGAEIRGLINLASTGTYTFRINSNDGIKVVIGGVLIHEDPLIHPDTMSDPIEFEVQEAGWYDFAVDYYQRKGTYALQMFWTPPTEGETIVPASAYGYLE